MEIEMKYAIESNDIAEQIWQDEYLSQIEEEDSREEVYMKAAYFDTENYVLSQNDIAMRVRKEGERMVAALKWRGENEGAKHMRGEVNVPVDDPNTFLLPDPHIFKESDIGKELIRLIGFKQLSSIVEMKFSRKRLRIDSGEGIMEVSIDRGEIITEKGKAPICELEIELFSGTEEALIKVSQRIAQKYGLKAEEKSKFLRGLEILGIK